MDKEYDLIIIGAGSTGSCIAYEASQRSLKVLIIDSGDIGGGTSSKSTKLLHGGIRYLEKAFKNIDTNQFKLVKESLFERNYWLKKVPFLTGLVNITIPTDNLFDFCYYYMGIQTYNLLSFKSSLNKLDVINQKVLYESFPNLKKDFNRGIIFNDGQFDDSRLNLLLALTAKKNNTNILTYEKVLKLTKDKNGKLNGVISQAKNGNIREWKAKVIINAAGIKADDIRFMAEDNLESKVLCSRGTHIVINQKFSTNNSGFIIPKTDDKRVIFLLPFYGNTLIGTTDNQCMKDEACFASLTEKKYLINHSQRYFPKVKLSNITSAWAAGRPLLRDRDESFSSESIVREHEVERLPCDLISPLGGKWTTCRILALDTLRQIEKVLNTKLKKNKKIPIIGTVNNYLVTKNLLNEQKIQLRKLLPDTELRESQIIHLQRNYGLTSLSLISKLKHNQKIPLSSIVPVCAGEFEHAYKFEYAKSISDVLIRRCKLGLVDFEEAKRLVPIVRNTLKENLSIDNNLSLN